jgi:hypothetical protein
MSTTVARKLSQVLRQIDRPGSFCVSGSVPAVLPGLEVEGLGPIALPLTAQQAKGLKKHCEPAPYGKGEQTLVDTNVRRVWHLKPERFALTNPDWQPFLQQTVKKIQEELGLEKQKLESHLYDLLLYEPGSFFLPHRDSEKLPRMVATVVLVLPSSFQGGELVVRHEGQEQVIDFGGDEDSRFRIHFAAFYADCEHEIRPLREGYRLCLVYNLTLKKGKKSLAAPRSREYIEPITQILRDWAKKDTPRKLVVMLEHQYTQDGLTWDALKGVDRVKARVLLEAAHQAGCQAFLALLTLHESGAPEDEGDYYGGYHGWYGGYEEDEEEEGEPGQHVMAEVFETSLTAEHWSDSTGKPLPIGPMDVDETEVLDPESLQDVTPEEQYEGYTGNEGMTLDRWYRHGATVLWPNQRHFAILCDAGSQSAIQVLKQMMDQWQNASSKEAAALRAQGIEFAATIMARWPNNPYRGFSRQEPSTPLLPLLALLDEPNLIKPYLTQVLAQDASVDPGESLLKICEKHGGRTFQPELEVVFKSTTGETIERNVRLLEQIALVNPEQHEGWIELCQTLGREAFEALERIDQDKPSTDYQRRNVDRAAVLTSLARALLATEQLKLLSRLVDHTLARPEQYPLTSAHVKALTTLEPWLKKNVTKPSPPMSNWIAACCEQLEALTVQAPQAPTDFRRPAAISHKCADCAELKKFLEDPQEKVHRFRVKEERRKHLEDMIRHHDCDLDLKTERTGSPYTLVCTKNAASYQRKLKKFQQDQEHLAMLRSIQASLPK